MEQIITWITSFQLTTFEMLMIVLFLGIIHPLISQPMYLLSVSLSIYFFGPLLGIPYLLFVNIIGIILYYFLIKAINKRFELNKKPKLIAAFAWLERTPEYKHSIAIGLPLVPTYAIKLALPMSEKRFKDYFMILFGSYLILAFFYVLVYYGILVIFLRGELTYLTFIVFALIIGVMYGSNVIRKKWMTK